VKAKKKMEANDSAEQWVSVEQIAQHLNVKPFTIYKWLERKEMPAHKVGRLWRFKTSEVDSWVKSGKAAMNSTEDDKE
jgi:excisionase family DNA binding protein